VKKQEIAIGKQIKDNVFTKAYFQPFLRKL